MILARPDVDEDDLFVYFTAHRNTQRKNKNSKNFLAEKRKSDRACENSSDKRQALNFFWTFQKKFLSKQGFYSEPNNWKFQEKT